MNRTARLTFGILFSCLFLGISARAQSETGSLEFVAHLTPTRGRTEPVRQFTFYILTKSYVSIVKDIEEQNPVSDRDKFIDGLTVSPELKVWLKAHETLDLVQPDVDKLLSPDDILGVPEFLSAYERSNSGGVTAGLPKPKYTEDDKTSHTEKYEKLHKEYLVNLKKFVKNHPETVSGVELELEGVNPQNKWVAIQNDRRRRVLRTAPDVAQLKYLAGKVETDLDGHAGLGGLVPGDYWISTLNLDADAGDMRVLWDVPVHVERGKTSRVELSNLNSTDAHSSAAP